MTSRPTLRQASLGALAALALAVPTAVVGTAAPATAAEPEVRIATYNIHFASGGLNNIVADIRKLDADVVVLQEVDDRSGSGGRNQATYIARKLGMASRYDPNATKGAGHKRGNAILSKFALSEKRVWDLPNPAPSQERRGLMRVTATLPSGIRMHVYATHLNPGAGKLKQAQKVRSVVGAPGCATFLGGDLNTHPGSREYDVVTANLDDLWKFKGRGDGGTGEGGGRIDYLMVRNVSPLVAKVAPKRHSDHKAVQGKIGVSASC